MLRFLDFFLVIIIIIIIITSVVGNLVLMLSLRQNCMHVILCKLAGVLLLNFVGASTLASLTASIRWMVVVCWQPDDNFSCYSVPTSSRSDMVCHILVPGVWVSIATVKCVSLHWEGTASWAMGMERYVVLCVSGQTAFWRASRCEFFTLLLCNLLVFTTRCYSIQSAVMPQYIVCLSVCLSACLSVCDIHYVFTCWKSFQGRIA